MKRPTPGLPASANLRRATVVGIGLAALLSGRARAAGDPAALVKLGEMNCTTCHRATEVQRAWLRPATAPSLKGIGHRINGNWLAEFLAAPHQAAPWNAMPDVLRGKKEQAEALAHYLVSLDRANFRPTLPDKAAVARGESLYHRIGCVACHAPQNGGAAPPDSVPLPRLSPKWSFDGLRKFLLDPLAVRPSGRMPAMHLTDGEASDLAHFLLRETRVPATAEVAYYRGRIRSLEDLDSTDPARTGPAAGFMLEGPMRDRGTAVRISAWLKVEQGGDYTFLLRATGASRFAVGGQWIMGQESWRPEKVNEKHTLHLDAGRHELKLDYVPRGPKEPSLALEWEGPGVTRGPIPGDRLSSEREPAVVEPPFVPDRAKAETGRALYASLDCATCHEGKAPSRPLPALAKLQPARGCLADTPSPAAPVFHLDAPARETLRRAVASLNDSSLGPPTAQQRVEQTMKAFRCTACHARGGQGGVSPERGPFFTSNVDDLGDEGRLPPNLDGVGDKLRPEWLAKVLGEGAGVRPYLNTRMPQFGAANVGHLAELFVTLDRQATPVPPSNDPPDAQREAGRRLAGTDGLSCIACHRFNRQPAHMLQVLDLLTTPERLNEDWFRRFLRDPNRFNPGTRMLPFWPGGRSLLPAVLDGDTDRQHAALWTFLSDGPKAKFPEGLSRQNMEIVIGGETVVYRGKLWEAGFRAIAAGFPGQINAAFDAEEMRLALAWRGRFLNAGAHWDVQGMGQIRPLGTDVVVFPHGPAFAILADANTPWPQDPGRPGGMKFRGYQLDAQKQPVLLYDFGSLAIEDALRPADANGKPALRRTLKFQGTVPVGLHLRLATGALSPLGDNNWRLDDRLTLRVGLPNARVRGAAEKQELIVPVRPRDGKTQVEVDYVW